MDYYKIKKILIILMCALTCLRIVNASKVFASEAVEVTPTWNDGTYTYQADNQFLTLRQNQLDIQDAFINFFYNMYANGDSTQKNNAKNTLIVIKQHIISSVPGTSGWGGSATRLIWFGRVTSNIDSSHNYGYFFQLMSMAVLNNIVYADATLDNGYKLLSVPFYSFNRNNNGARAIRYVNVNDGTNYADTTGTALVPVAEVGCYSTRWLDVFQLYGLIETQAEYEDALLNLEGILAQDMSYNYTTSYYATQTNSVVTNTYNFVTDDEIDTYNSLGISAPNVSDNIDLTDVFDSLETLMTNENYVAKNFTFSLPGNRNFNFSINPNILQNNLVRIGGENVISIVHAMWYIGLYGWYIFAYIGLFSKLLTGDWLHLIKGTSPITNIVKMSVSSMVGGG